MDAGFYVVGVDIVSQPHYCGDEFIQADALTFPLDGFDVIHASPVCKGYTELNYIGKEKHERLILPVKERLRQSGKPFVIENVSGAKLELPGALWLCGSMFGLQVRRHRLFESNILLFAPGPCRHDRNFYSIHGHHVWNRAKRSPARKDGRWRPGYGTVEEGARAMGIAWMHKQAEISQAIPPVYTLWIGEQLMQALQAESRGVAG
jgi:DNA (cytosine-5)-methyltransferase 1